MERVYIYGLFALLAMMGLSAITFGCACFIVGSNAIMVLAGISLCVSTAAFAGLYFHLEDEPAIRSFWANSHRLLKMRFMPAINWLISFFKADPEKLTLLQTVKFVGLFSFLSLTVIFPLTWAFFWLFQNKIAPSLDKAFPPNYSKSQGLDSGKSEEQKKQELIRWMADKIKSEGNK